MTQLEALLLSLMVEVPVVALLAWRFAGARGSRLAPVALAAVAATLLTHPIAWWLNTAGLRGMPFATRAAVIEAGVVVAEGGLLMVLLGWRWRRSVGVSALANAVSFAVGIAVVRMGWL